MTSGNTKLGLAHAYRRLLQRIADRSPLPAVAEVLLPAPAPDPMKQDEFGFVLLADGSAGPFYTCLGDTRSRIEASGSSRSLVGVDPVRVAMELGAGELHRSALALGALNAVSQHLMRRCGFDPAAGEGVSTPSKGRVGMVGYFGPLIERYLALGLEVTVIEQRPERVPAELGLQVFTSPGALTDCDYVICTASTLINDSLEEVLACVRPPTVFNLMGPSASLLPDPLFQRGVGIVGGIVIDDLQWLREALREGSSWGAAGRKYQLTRKSYPGLEHMLERAG